MKNIQDDFKNIFIFIGLCSLIDIIINNQINFESLLTVMFIFSMSISILSILTIMIFQDAKIDNLYKYLTIGSSIINIYYLNFIVNINTALVTNLNENKFSKGFFILSIIEPLIIFFSISSRKKNINLKKLIVIESVIFFFLIFIVNNVEFISDSFKYLTVKIIFLVLSIILYFGVIKEFHKNKNNISEENYKKINISFICKLLCIMIVCIFLFYRNILIFALYPAFKTIGDYYLIKIIIKEIVINTANNLHYKLNQKSKLLEETVNKLENSQIMLKSALSRNKVLLQAFPDGVILVNDEIITYVNRETLSILELGCEEEIVGKNILNIKQLNRANTEKKCKKVKYTNFLNMRK